MIRLDTIKFEIPQEAILSLDEGKTYKTSQLDCQDGSILNFQQFKADALPIGVSSIKTKEGGSWHLTLSAKVLLDDYLGGIHLNSLERALAHLSPCLEVDLDTLWDANPKVHRFDTTNNIPLASLDAPNHKVVMDALLVSTSNSFFDAKTYGGARQCGIVIQGRQEAQNRLIAYAKHLDLARPKSQPFLDACINPNRLRMEASKQVRIEVNHSNHKTIKQRLNIANIGLREVLTSTSLVNYDYLLKVTNGGKQLALFGDIQRAIQEQGQSFDGERYLISQGMVSIVNQANGNIKEVQRAIQLLFGDRWRYHWFGRKDAKGGIKGGLKFLAQQEIDRINANQYNLTSFTPSNKITSNLLEALRMAS
jgi:hypothetical protein